MVDCFYALTRGQTTQTPGLAVTEWITHDQAAMVLGSHRSMVGKLIDRGLLHPRGLHGHYPSIDRAEVEALAEQRTVEAVERARRRRNPARRIRPPDTDHEWLSTSQAAAVLGLGTPQAVVNRCNRGTLACTWASGRRWIRRDLLYQVERAKDAGRTRQLEV